MNATKSNAGFGRGELKHNIIRCKNLLVKIQCPKNTLQHRQLHRIFWTILCTAKHSTALCLPSYATLMYRSTARLRRGRCISTVRSYPYSKVGFVGSCGVTLTAFVFYATQLVQLLIYFYFAWITVMNNFNLITSERAGWSTAYDML